MTPRPTKSLGQPPKSLLRNLGAFFGHIAHSVRTPVHPPEPPSRVVREQVHEHEVQTPEGKIVLRRRIIDEVAPAPDVCE
ncbi:MAG TPA: hypothetical protein VHC70_04785 [Phycisphaerales bacterium]|jgi:hypothetical protein|nr:hypothetical protein [Phycisphaerales bacterium]